MQSSRTPIRPHPLRRPVVLVAALALALSSAVAALGATDTEVTVGSNDAIFAQNKQNEPWVAIDPSNPDILASGANDEIDLESCDAGDPTTCPFTNGVGVSGVTFSFDGGASWQQPTYTGYSARNCLGPDPCQPGVGPIGTLPKYFESGLVSDGDPSLQFGPRPGPDGSFSWANGSRLYYATLTSNFSAQRDEATFKGAEAIAVSRTDDVVRAAAGDDDAWMAPVIASKQSSALFSDKEALWVDNAESSPYFGNVYVCNVAFRSNGGAPEPVVFLRSTDGGDTFTSRQITNAANTNSGQGRSGGRQGCLVRSDSQGGVYVVYRGSLKGEDVMYLTRSFDGGQRFDKPRAVARTGSVGKVDPVQGRLTFDGVAGSRTNTSVWIDVANGAPSGGDATDTIVISWADGRLGLNNERMLIRLSEDRGTSFGPEFAAHEASDRPDFPAVAISPDGTDLYAVYMGFLDPYRERADLGDRRFQGVVRHAETSTPGAWVTLHRGILGDARGSSANSLTVEFLGDYNDIMATRDGAYAVFNDVRDATVCPAINAYRQSLVDGSLMARPAPNQDCPPVGTQRFGNTDIYGTFELDPTP